MIFSCLVFVTSLDGRTDQTRQKSVSLEKRIQNHPLLYGTGSSTLFVQITGIGHSSFTYSNYFLSTRKTAKMRGLWTAILKKRKKGKEVYVMK